MLIGVDYHAERWPESSWAADAQLMRQMGVQVVFLGQYSWCRIEPRRDRFHFDWLIACADTFGQHGLKVVLCCPASAPPPWLFERHGSILPVDETAARWWLGGTDHICINSAPYRKYMKRMLLELAGAFQTHPHVFGWSLDAGPAARSMVRCYCDDCVQEFRAWLKQRYGTIGRLNELWGTAFWGMEFTDWHEVPAPRRTPYGPMPAMALDWRRFVSDAAVSFVREQKDILQRFNPKVRLTSRWCAAPSPDLDVLSLAGVVDVTAFGPPPVEPCRHDIPRDVFRTGKPFWLFGLPAGLRQDESGLGPALQPGRLRLNILRAYAQGAELAAFSRWRTSPFGQRFYEEGIVDPDPAVKPRFEEIRQAVAEVAGLDERLGRPAPRALAAILIDFDWTWALEAPPLSPGLSMEGVVQRFRSALHAMGLGADLVGAAEDLAGYRLIVLPCPLIVPRGLAEKIHVAANNGAALVLTALAGSRTDFNTRELQTPPGVLAELAGIDVLGIGGPGAGAGVIGADGEPMGRAEAVLERVAPRSAEPIAAFADGPLQGQPAVCAHRLGRASVYYLAAMPDQTLAASVIRRVATEHLPESCLPLPPDVELIRSEDGSRGKAIFLFNHSDNVAEVVLPESGRPWREVLSGSDIAGILRIEPRGAAVLT